MKSILSLIILLTFIIKIGGYYAYLCIEKEMLHEKIERKIVHSIPKSKLICIIANPENEVQIEWKRPQKEFRFKGCLYDIVSTELKQGVKYYFCISDKDETLLETKIEDLCKNSTEHLPLSNNGKHLLALFFEPITIHTNPTFSFSYFFNQPSSPFPVLLQTNTSDFISVLEQPPQF